MHQCFAVSVGMKSIKNLKQVNTPDDCNEGFVSPFGTSLRLLLQLQLQQRVLAESGAQPVRWTHVHLDNSSAE